MKWLERSGRADRARWACLAGLAAVLGCGDDVSEVEPPATTSGGTTDGTTTAPASSSSSSSGPPLDDTSTTSQVDTTLGVSATDTGTSDETTSLDTSTGSSEAGETSSSTGPEPVVEPVAQPDGACMLRQQDGVLVDPLANDFDPQGSPVMMTAYDMASAAGGTVTLMDGVFTYTPPEGFWGEDVFTYTIADPEGNEAVGEVHVMVWPGPIAASELVAGNHGLAISPDIGLGRLGWSVAGGGDLDGDGRDDVVLSAPFAWNGMGRIYVVFGRPDPAPIVLTSVASGDGGYVLYGDFINEYAGWSVDVLDDLDGDGNDDLAIGAGWSNAAGTRAGRVVVVFSQAFGGTLALSDVLGVDAYAIDGAAPEDWAGWAVAGTGDVNGDGIGEVLVGAPQATDVLPAASGHAYVVYGKADTLPVSLADVLAGAGGGFAMVGQAGDHVGFSAVALPDLDGDGLPELAVGSETAAGGAGRTYVVQGTAAPSPVSLAAVMGELGGFGFEGAAPGIALGRSADAIGDLDGDGLPEIMVAAPGPALAGDAAVHVIYGGSASSLVLGVPPPDQGATIDSLALGDDLGWSVAGLPDWNGDGIPDLALGAPSAGGEIEGAVYVVFGRADMTDIDLDEIAQGRGGFVVTGEDWDDDAGWSVASAGDFDGDGSTDLLIGAPQAEGLGNFSGRAYVVLGVAPGLPELGACVPE